MEGLLTLIVLIIVFNMIGAVMRAIRGSKPASGTLPRNKADYTTTTIQGRPAGSNNDQPYYTSLPPDHTGREFEYDQVLNGQGLPDRNDLLEAKDTGIAQELDNDQQLAQPGECKTSSSSSIMSGLHQALTRQDPLVSAFIFHEIFRKPPALRRRG